MVSLERTGWLLFIAGSVVFTLDGVINGNWWTMGGGALYVVGCGALFAASSRSVGP